MRLGITAVALAIALGATARGAQDKKAETKDDKKTELPPCPKTASLEVGQKRAEAFEMMSMPVANEKTYKFVPTNRTYTVDVTFDSAAADAKVTSLHYVWNPPQNLLKGIFDRYGKPTITAADAPAAVWRVPHCGVEIRYLLQMTTDGKPGQEEMWVEPLALEKKPDKKPEKKAGYKKK